MIFRKLANGQYDELHDLVEENLLNRLKQYFGELSEEQRSNVRFDEEDIMFANFNDMNIREKGNRTHLSVDMACIIMSDVQNVDQLPPLFKGDWNKSMDKYVNAFARMRWHGC